MDYVQIIKLVISPLFVFKEDDIHQKEKIVMLLTLIMNVWLEKNMLPVSEGKKMIIERLKTIWKLNKWK